MPSSKPATLWAGLGFRGSAASLEVGVEGLLLRGAWSRLALRNIQCFLLPVQHLVTTKSFLVRLIHGKLNAGMQKLIHGEYMAQHMQNFN
jgi:hypothetical protein